MGEMFTSYYTEKALFFVGQVNVYNRGGSGGKAGFGGNGGKVGSAVRRGKVVETKVDLETVG